MAKGSHVGTSESELFPVLFVGVLFHSSGAAPTEPDLSRHQKRADQSAEPSWAKRHARLPLHHPERGVERTTHRLQAHAGRRLCKAAGRLTVATWLRARAPLRGPRCSMLA